MNARVLNPMLQTDREEPADAARNPAKGHSLSKLVLVPASYAASRRLVYGARGKLIAESLEDEKKPMADGCDYNGGDGRQRDDNQTDTEESEIPSNAATIDDVEDEGSMRNQQIRESNMINPTGSFRRTWDLVQAILLIYIAIVVPFRLGFDQPTKPWQVSFVLDILIDIYFWTDLIMNFRTAVYTTDGEVVVSPQKVARLYLFRWFPVDLISCLPFAYIDLLLPSKGDEGNSGFAKLFRLMRLLKLLRLVRFKQVSKRTTTQSRCVSRLCCWPLKTHTCLFFRSFSIDGKKRFTHPMGYRYSSSW
eukprot:SAG31_NODE_3420_length_4297_cov_4.123294_4_plen_306_part_00